MSSTLLIVAALVLSLFAPLTTAAALRDLWPHFAPALGLPSEVSLASSIVLVCVVWGWVGDPFDRKSDRTEAELLGYVAGITLLRPVLVWGAAKLALVIFN